VSLAAKARHVCGGWVTCAENVELRLRIIGAGNPDLRASVPRGVEAGPRVQSHITLLHRYGVELPLQLAGFRIERLEKARGINIVSRADKHVVADYNRGRSRKVPLRQIRDRLVPALLACLGLE